MTRDQRIDVLSIRDLACARLANPPLDPHVEHDLRQIVQLTDKLLGLASPTPCADQKEKP